MYQITILDKEPSKIPYKENYIKATILINPWDEQEQKLDQQKEKKE